MLSVKLILSVVASGKGKAPNLIRLISVWSDVIPRSGDTSDIAALFNMVLFYLFIALHQIDMKIHDIHSVVYIYTVHKSTT